MPLQTGTRLGPCEIVAPLARVEWEKFIKLPTRDLNRTVAVKVLPPQFSENLEMKQRSEREAQTIACVAPSFGVVCSDS
jgi:hypothetical protein